MLLAKNPAGWSEVLHHLSRRGGAVVIAVNARVADGKDPSWLWDVPYELLPRVLGRRVRRPRASTSRSDCATRSVEHIVERDPIAAAARLPGEDVHIIASYTQFSALYRRFG